MTTNYSSHFETRTRDNGETFTCLKDDRPDWLKDAVWEAHQTDGPNDWIYAECAAAVEAFDAGDLTDEDGLHAYADARVDIYTRDAFQWAADMCLSSTYSYAEEAANDMGTDTKEIVKALQAIQFCAIETIARTMLEACTEVATAGEEVDA